MLTDGEGSGGDVDDHEVTDECAMLIHTDHMHKHVQIKNGQDKSQGILEYIVHTFDTFISSVTNNKVSFARFINEIFA